MRVITNTVNIYKNYLSFPLEIIAFLNKKILQIYAFGVTLKGLLIFGTL